MDEFLEQLKKYAVDNNIPILQCDARTFIEQILLLKQPKTILEIGSAIGYSGIVMLNAAKKAHLTTIEKNAERVSLAIENFKKANLSERVNLIQGDAKDVLEELTNLKNGDAARVHGVSIGVSNESFSCADSGTLRAASPANYVISGSQKFDFIFLDGPKGQYANYFPFIKKLLADGGVLVADNVMLGTSGIKKLTNTQLIKKRQDFVDMIMNDDELITSIVPICDILSLSIKQT